MKTSWLKWMIPAFLVTVLFFGCGRQPGEKLYYKALSQWEKGNQVRARALLEKSIRRRAGSLENTDAYNRLGLLLWEMGETEEAVVAFGESLHMDAGQVDVLGNLGVALISHRDFSAAEQTLREVALRQPNDARSLAYIGMAYLQNQQWNEASRYLQLALTPAPEDPNLQTALALSELHTHGAAAALRRLQALAQKYPDYAPALFNMASIYQYDLNNATEATRWLKRYLEQASSIDDFSTLARTQLNALESGEKTASLSYTAPQTRDRKAAEQYFKRALAAHRAGKTTTAIPDYIQAIEKDDHYEQAFYNLGLAYYATSQMSLASEAFEQAVQLNPAFVDARYNAALVAYYNLGQTERALRELNTVLSQQPDYQPAIDLIKRIKK